MSTFNRIVRTLDPPESAPPFRHRTDSYAHKVAVRVAQAWRRWRSRRKLRDLLELEDRLLMDVGVTRGDVVWAMRLPPNVDPADALHRARRGRRAECFKPGREFRQLS